jgi:hypothetical protein
MPEKKRSGNRSICESKQKLYIVRKILCMLQWIVTALVVVKEPTNASRREYDLLMNSKFYPNMFQQVIAIIRGSYLPQKLVKQYL